MQLILKSIISKSVNNFSQILTVSVIICSLFLTSSCNGNLIKGQTGRASDSSLVLDSLRIDLDSNGHNALIKIVEVGDKQNRIIKIEFRRGVKTYRTLINHELIPCSTCGRQSGEPYTTIDLHTEAPKAFDIHLEYLTYTFVLDFDNAYLNKIDLFHVTPAKDRYIEWHEIYTTRDFGKLAIEQVKADLELQLRDSATLNKIIDGNSRR